MATWGTENKEGVRISYDIDFDGVTNRFRSDDIVDISSLSNAGDSISSRRKIADLTFSVYDEDGSVWTELGHGTDAFGKDISLKINVGGTYGYTGDSNGTSFGFLGTDGADTFQAHQGEIVFVSKQDKLITIRTQNKLNKIKNLQWQMPVRIYGATHAIGSIVGSYGFYEDFNSITVEEHWNDRMLPYSLYNKNEELTQGDFYAHMGTGITFTGIYGTGIYDTTGTGIVDFKGDDFEWLDTSFHTGYPRKKFKGTFLGTYTGTINEDAVAKSYGFTDITDADSKNIADDPSTDTGTYPIGKIKATFGTTFPVNDGTKIAESQLMHIVGDPTAVVRHCLFGKMVSDFLDEDTDMGNTFAVSQKISAFQVYDQIIDPETSVDQQISDALDMTSSIFFVNTSNEFEMAVYGPIDYRQTVDFIGSSKIISSSYNNDINDFYNKVTLKYGWNFDNNSFDKEKSESTGDWSVLNNRTLAIDSKWVKNDNQANNFVSKLLNRHKNTSPEIKTTLSLEESGRELGSLISIEDPTSFTGTKIVQIVEYTKDFSGGKKVTLRCLDGESLHRQRGYAKWEDSAIGAVVSGTSTSGWSAGAGTVNNIGTEYYGDYFTWW